MKSTQTKTGITLGLSSLLFLGLAALIFFEFLRPFHDSNIDKPIVLWALGLGALLSSLALGLRKGAIVLNAIALLLNVIALTILGLVLWSLSHMKLM